MKFALKEKEKNIKKKYLRDILILNSETIIIYDIRAKRTFTNRSDIDIFIKESKTKT